jgi:hypothetical protein
VLACISAVHFIVRARKFAVNEDTESWSWTYILLSFVLFLFMPFISGFFGVLVAGVSWWLIFENEEESIPSIVRFAFVIFILLVLLAKRIC